NSPVFFPTVRSFCWFRSHCLVYPSSSSPIGYYQYSDLSDLNYGPPEPLATTQRSLFEKHMEAAMVELVNNFDNLEFIITKAREYDVQVPSVDENSGSNATDDGELDILDGTNN